MTGESLFFLYDLSYLKKERHQHGQADKDNEIRGKKGHDK
jgi:hypothetical protein